METLSDVEILLVIISGFIVFSYNLLGRSEVMVRLFRVQWEAFKADSIHGEI